MGQQQNNTGSKKNTIWEKSSERRICLKASK